MPAPHQETAAQLQISIIPELIFTEATILLRKCRLPSATYFALLAIFMALQWSPPHAHLTGEHEHSCDRHHDSAEIHAHQTLTQHPDAIDSADIGHIDIADDWVVELDQSKLPSGVHQPDPRPIRLVAEYSTTGPENENAENFL